MTVEPRPLQRTSRRQPARIIGPIVVFVAFLGLWYFMSHVGLSPEKRFLLPSPDEVVRTTLSNSNAMSPILHGLWLSTKVALIGLGLSMLIGISLATLMSQADWIEWSVWPYAVALQCIPVLALTPLIGGLLGFSFSARVVVTVMISLFPILSNTLFGLLAVDRGQLDLFILGRSSRWQRLWKLQLPAALPSTFAGFRISAGLAVIGAVVGDTFFRQGEPGIGALIDVYRTRLQGEEMIAAIVLAAILGLTLFAVVGVATRLAIGRWHDGAVRT